MSFKVMRIPELSEQFSQPTHYHDIEGRDKETEWLHAHAVPRIKDWSPGGGMMCE